MPSAAESGLNMREHARFRKRTFAGGSFLYPRASWAVEISRISFVMLAWRALL